MRKSILNFIYTIHLKVYTNLKTLAPIGVEKSVTEISIGKKEKLTNKGTDLQYMAVFVTQYNSSLSSFVPNFRILSQVVAEKSLTEKVYIQKRQKTLYPLYTSYWEYKYLVDSIYQVKTVFSCKKDYFFLLPV